MVTIILALAVFLLFIDIVVDILYPNSLFADSLSGYCGGAGIGMILTLVIFLS